MNAAGPAAEDGWRCEYPDAIISLKVVVGVEDAIRHYVERIW
jgi:gamma-glutamyl phosphate reductase